MKLQLDIGSLKGRFTAFKAGSLEGFNYMCPKHGMVNRPYCPKCKE